MANVFIEKGHGSQAQWLKPVTLVTQKGEIRKIAVRDQPKEKVHEAPISTNDWVTVVCTCHPRKHK
jgi:hypothetical protein